VSFFRRPRSASLRRLAGRGTITHVVGLMLENQVKIKANWVPFDSAPENLAALAGKHIDFSIQRVETVMLW